MSESEPDDTSEEILRATHEALRKHGYADLSMAKIADEFEGSQSLIHYHFDGKAGLVAEYVRWARQRYEERAASFPDKPEERLDALLSSLVDGEFTDDDAMMSAIIEMYGQAPENERLRRELAAFDETFRRLIRETLEDGIESGVFRDVDVDTATWLVFAAHESAFLRRLLGEDVTDLRDALDAFVLSEVRR